MNLVELEFPVFVTALIANVTLVLIVFRYAPKDRSRLLFFLFIHSFLNKKDIISRSYSWSLVILVGIFVLLARSPFLFTHTEVKNGIITPIAGIGMALFGIYAFTFIILPFVLFTVYAMIRHKLLNIKALLAELAVILLNLILVIQLVNTTSVGQYVTNFLVLIGTSIVGILLVRGVNREVKQRQQLEILDKQLEAANEKLKILDKARADFITIASHQLRTPPATIKWYLASILDGDYGKMDPSVHEQLRKTMMTNNSMVALIDDLLNASRIERGKLEFIFQPTNLAEITQITVDQLLPQAEMKKIELVYEKPKEAMPELTADKEKLRQVINNLVDNAIKYTPAGKVTVSISKNDKEITLKVTDTGRGVSKDQMSHVFEKYDRGNRAPKNSTGLGLGLYVAKVIIAQHKGKIWVESKGEGKGSSFIFTIPLNSKLSSSVFDLTKDQKVEKQEIVK